MFRVSFHFICKLGYINHSLFGTFQSAIIFVRLLGGEEKLFKLLCMHILPSVTGRAPNNSIIPAKFHGLVYLIVSDISIFVALAPIGYLVIGHGRRCAPSGIAAWDEKSFRISNCSMQDARVPRPLRTCTNWSTVPFFLVTSRKVSVAPVIFAQ